MLDEGSQFRHYLPVAGIVENHKRRRRRDRGNVGTVFLRAAIHSRLGTRRQGNDRSIPIVAETERISNRRNSPLNSRAPTSDRSGRRFFIVSKKMV